MKCDELINFFSAYLDDEIDADGRRMIEEHLAGCARCRREMEQISQSMKLLSAHLPELEPTPSLWAGIVDRIEAAPATVHPGFWRSWRGWTLAAAAGLALFGFIATGLWYRAQIIFERSDLQLEWQNYAQQRQRVVRQGNPFRQAAAPPANSAAEVSDENPFTPYLKVRHRNPFLEAE